MSDMITDMVSRLFRDHRTQPAATAMDPALWRAIEEMGLPLALVPEDRGGFGLDPAEACDILRLAGEQAILAPLAETMLANHVLALAGLDPAAGPLAVVVPGALDRVPFGRNAAALVVVDGASVDLLPGPFTVTEGRNLAGEPRDRLVATAAPIARAGHAINPETLQALRAVLTAARMAGAARAVLDLSIAYANGRVQFGKPIAKFQVIQHHIAVIASEVAAATAGAEMAAAGIAHAATDPAGFVAHAAAAKIRAGEAAGRIAALAHQIHGAIGITREYELQLFTRRLWAWRDEDGGEAAWAETLGNRLFATGAAGLWPAITREIGAPA